MDDGSTSITIAVLVQLALHEAKNNLNDTWVALAESLSRPERRGPTLSPDQLRKYGSGTERISKRRALDILNLITSSNLAGPITANGIKRLLITHPKGLGLLPTDEVEKISAELKDLRDKTSKLEKTAVENLRKSLNKLSDFVWNRHELEYVALAAIQEITRYEGSADTCGGGLLTPSSLPIFRKQDCHHEHVILSWSVSNYLGSISFDQE